MEQSEEKAMSTKKVPNDELKKKVVLYVEDEPTTRGFFSAMLRRLFKEVYDAEDGEAAFKLYIEKKPDIVITDIEMPRLNGMELTKKIKNENPSQTVIIITAFEDELHLVENADAALVKPIQRDELIDVLNRFA